MLDYEPVSSHQAHASALLRLFQKPKRGPPPSRSFRADHPAGRAVGCNRVKQCGRKSIVAFVTLSSRSIIPSRPWYPVAVPFNLNALVALRRSCRRRCGPSWIREHKPSVSGKNPVHPVHRCESKIYPCLTMNRFPATRRKRLFQTSRAPALPCGSFESETGFVSGKWGPCPAGQIIRG